MKHKSQLTTDPIQISDCSGVRPEWGRDYDCRRMFGIKRGTLRNLAEDGKIKTVLLRVRGQKSGVRLYGVDSIRALIEGALGEAPLN